MEHKADWLREVLYVNSSIRSIDMIIEKLK